MISFFVYLRLDLKIGGEKFMIMPISNRRVNEKYFAK